MQTIKYAKARIRTKRGFDVETFEVNNKRTIAFFSQNTGRIAAITKG
jgi:hypothetical protein